MKKLFIADVNIKKCTFTPSTHTVHLLDVEGHEIGWFRGYGANDADYKATTLSAITIYIANFTYLPHQTNVQIRDRNVIWLVHVL